MRVYIASNFADKDRVKARGEELAALGIECTSRWALETAPHNCKITDVKDDYLRETAVFDIEDILNADALVLTVPTPEELMNLTPHQMSRGGRTFESGFIYGLMVSARQYGMVGSRRLIVMGAKENVFHFLDGKDQAAPYPVVVVLPNWEAVKYYLAAHQTK
jgi:hypothetical protein